VATKPEGKEVDASGGTGQNTHCGFWKKVLADFGTPTDYYNRILEFLIQPIIVRPRLTLQSGHSCCDD
jgi:hypothetical protein